MSAHAQAWARGWVHPTKLLSLTGLTHIFGLFHYRNLMTFNLRGSCSKSKFIQETVSLKHTNDVVLTNM